MTPLNPTKENPANEPKRFVIPADFQAMTLPTQKLAAPEVEGWHPHWFNRARVPRALAAYYRFADDAEVGLKNTDIGGDMRDSGNTDLGTRVSVVAGDDLDNTGQPNRMYLMYCRNELFEESQRLLAIRNESIAEALRGGKIAAGEQGETPVDVAQRYVKGPIDTFFHPNKPKRRI